MNKNKLCYLTTLICLCLTGNLYAQEDYIIIASDTSVLYGVKLIESNPLNNASYIQVEDDNGQIKKYTPYEILEYAFHYGKAYRSFDIDVNGKSQRFFFQRFFSAQFYLYYLRTRRDINKYYFTTADSLPLIAIPKAKKEYVPFLQSLTTNCSQSTVNAQYVKLKKNNLKRFFRGFLSCSESSLPRIRIGITSGLSLTKFSPKVPDVFVGTPNYIFGAPDYNYSPDIFLGLVLDVPIAMSNYSLNTQILIKRSKSFVAFSKSSVDYDLSTSNTWLNIPLLLRYTYYPVKVKPFFEMGFIYARSLENNIELFKYSYDRGDVYIDFDDTPAISDNQVGLSVGGGAVLKYDSKYSLFGEIRYGALYSKKQRSGKLNVNEIFLTVGIFY